ncbi:MAG: GatB/YqeY domain-containing protein [Bacteriovoracaceae bacterium]
MRIKEKIEFDLNEALKTGDQERLSILRLLKNAVKNIEIESRKELSEEEVINALNRESKKTRDSISQFEIGGRSDLAAKEKKDLAIIDSYLPEKMSESKIRILIKKKISEDNATNFGEIMGRVMREIGTQADGNIVKRILEEELR